MSPFSATAGSATESSVRMPAEKYSIVRTYRNPSVHEVILDALFESEISENVFLDLPKKLEASLGKAKPIELQNFGLLAAPGFGPEIQIARILSGWQFEEGDTPKWLVRLQKNRITLNMARSMEWPRGEYVGWDSIFQRFHGISKLLDSSFSEQKVRRAGLRYINRFSIPAGNDVSDWSTISIGGPPRLKRAIGFHFRGTWTEIAGHPKLSATINLAQEDARSRAAGDDRVPFLLDIDVFNLLPADAPDFSRFADWYLLAHQAENRVFEDCITDKLRELFDKE